MAPAGTRETQAVQQSWPLIGPDWEGSDHAHTRDAFDSLPARAKPYRTGLFVLGFAAAAAALVGLVSVRPSSMAASVRGSQPRHDPERGGLGYASAMGAGLEGIPVGAGQRIVTLDGVPGNESAGKNGTDSDDASEKVHFGDTVFLRTHTGNYIDITGTEVQARYEEHLDWQALTIERTPTTDHDEKTVQKGDHVYLRSQHTLKYLNIEDTDVEAMHYTHSKGQAFIVEAEHDGTIHTGDTVYLRSAATGMNIDIEGSEARARFNQKNAFSALTIVKKAFLNHCSGSGENCKSTKCCKETGMTCFKKDDWWAQCREACAPGPDPLDPTGPNPWLCEALGHKTHGEVEHPRNCSGRGEDCRKSKCCHDAGMTCYEKNDGWATCQNTCTPGPDLKDANGQPWSCKMLGKTTPGVGAWVPWKCAPSGQDCRVQQCCADSGHQCYMKDKTYAECKPACAPNQTFGGAEDEPWSCLKIGSLTPVFEKPQDKHHGMVSPWVAQKCSDEGADCSQTKCCRGVGMQCFLKTEGWATCKPSCSTAPDPYDGNFTWSCEALGPRSWGLATEGYPSLFCFSVLRVEGYEPNLMRSQVNQSAGIFSCDGYLTLADGVISLGTPKDKEEVMTQEIPKIAVGISQDGTAANAKLFMAAWDKIIADGSYRNYDWTVKVDPDAVLLGWRLRDHMRPHTGANVYVVNCNKFPGSPNFPMMYGALEIFSLAAMVAYAQGSWRCGQNLPWGAWGEDYYMTHCMDYLGVGRIGDFGVLGDGMCTGSNCANAYTAAFHPFKSIGLWMNCWGTATSMGL